MSLSLMLIQGTRPLVNTVLSLKNNGTFLVAGPRYDGGVLIFAITRPHPAGGGAALPLRASTNASAGAAAQPVMLVGIRRLGTGERRLG